MFGPGASTAEEKKPGFVATIAGYSPHAKIGELIDPHGVADKPDKWGFVTRLSHLDDFVADGNSPFEIFKKTDPEQYKLEIGEVSWEAQIPAGIGIRDVRYKPTPGGAVQQDNAEWVLIDPMTREIISKIPEWDENGRPKLDRGLPVQTVNDHWFVLNVKFVWRDAPESVKAKAPEIPAYMRGRISPTPVTPKSPSSPQGVPRATGRRDLTAGIDE